MEKSLCKLRSWILLRMSIVADIFSCIPESKSPSYFIRKAYSDGKLQAFSTVLSLIDKFDND